MMRVSPRPGIALLVVAIAVGGCSAVPNLDAGSAGCQNAGGSGQREGSVPIAPLLIGKSPVEAASIAAARGHRVVFSVQIPGYGECWCKPPPNGKVVEAWWGQHGALWLMVEGVEAGHSADSQPFLGWGC
jgi:hypothetical protein